MHRFPNPNPHATSLSFYSSSRGRSRCLHVSAASAVAKQTPTFYDILSIAPTARGDEIKAAFKKAALRWHPDTCQSHADKQVFSEQFKRVREAYEVLSDPLHRHCYDISIGIRGCFERKERGEVYRAWEIQLEGLRRRPRSEDTWAARVRRANERNQSQPSD